MHNAPSHPPSTVDATASMHKPSGNAFLTNLTGEQMCYCRPSATTAQPPTQVANAVHTTTILPKKFVTRHSGATIDTVKPNTLH